MNECTTKNRKDQITPEEFCGYCRRLYDRHLVSGVGGNLSLRSGRLIYLTPSGYSLGDVGPEKVVVFRNGRTTPPEVQPTRDADMHLRILKSRRDIHAVCHIHSAPIVAVSTVLEPGPQSLPALTPGFVYLAHPLPLLPFMVPGSEHLSKAVEETFSGKSLRAVLLQNHGLVTLGRDFHEAINIAEEIHEAAQVYLLTRGAAHLIPQGDLDKIGRGH
jgi:3-dehydro-4-phosphotetronate decarboxylase